MGLPNCFEKELNVVSKFDEWKIKLPGKRKIIIDRRGGTWVRVYEYKNRRLADGFGEL